MRKQKSSAAVISQRFQLIWMEFVAVLRHGDSDDCGCVWTHDMETVMTVAVFGHMTWRQ